MRNCDINITLEEALRLLPPVQFSGNPQPRCVVMPTDWSYTGTLKGVSAVFFDGPSQGANPYEG